MKTRNFYLLIIFMLLSMAAFFSCGEKDTEDNPDISSLTGTWELVNIAADVTATDDMEKALASADLVTTAFPKRSSLYIFYPNGTFEILTDQGESIRGTYLYRDNSLYIQFGSGGKATLDVWISGNTMRLDEDFSNRYIYEGSPYNTITRATKIHHLVKQTY